jgi:hypothetical protein
MEDPMEDNTAQFRGQALRIPVAVIPVNRHAIRFVS